MLFAFSELLGAAIKFLVVGAGVAGEPFHFYPPKTRPAAGTHFFHRTRRRVVNSLDVFADKLGPVVRFENAEREWIYFPGRSADSVSVVFHNEQDRQFSFFGETNRFEKIALTCRRIADGGDDDIFLSIQLNAPGNSACGQELRAGGRRHTPNVKIGIAIMRRHHPTAAARFALGKIFEPQLFGRHSAPEDQSAVTIKRNNVIIRIHLNGDCGERFMTHSRRVKMAFALPIQILFAQIAVATLEQNR